MVEGLCTAKGVGYSVIYFYKVESGRLLWICVREM